MAKVLIVDDSRTSRKILRELLESDGHEVVGEASNGEEGIVCYKELRPDLVTMDITMPNMDGLESLIGIKKEDRDAKVIMITAAGQKGKMLQAIKDGADDFITKPFDAEQILGAVRNVLKTP